MKTSTFDATFYGSKISGNISETPEGFLVCHDVKLARTGTQEYLGRELGFLPACDHGKMITVYRSPEEVFSPATIASFEGKPFTNNHPHKLIDVDDAGIYLVGHIQNIRKCDDGIHLLCDIVVNDKQTISDILNGKREVSAGYTADYVQQDDGSIHQTNIRGNHLALVDAGRAGSKVKITDSKPKGETTMVLKKGNVFTRVIKALVKDEASEEEISEAVEAMKPAEDEGEDALAQVLSRLDAIEAKVEAMTKKDEEVHEENGLDELEGDIKKELIGDEEEVEGEEKKIIEAKDAEEVDPLKAVADAKAFVLTLPKEQRKLVADSMASVIRATRTQNNVYAQIAQRTSQVQDKKEVVAKPSISEISKKHLRK